MEAGLSVEEVEEGNRVVERLLRTWASSLPENDDVMADIDILEDPEAQIAELKKCVERFRAQIEGNIWVQRVLASLT